MSEHPGLGVTRREVLVGVAGGLALAAIDPAPAFAQGATVSGLVFEDRDGSGVASAANPGLAGVLVSNGRDIALTGADGRYTLPLPDEATIFVVKPAGFMPPLEPETNLPRFYRHHQPKGSPPPGRAERVRCRVGDRSAARDRGGSRFHSRGPDPGACGSRRQVRAHRR